MKVQTRTTLEQKMMPIKNEEFRTIKKHDLMKTFLDFGKSQKSFTVFQLLIKKLKEA